MSATNMTPVLARKSKAIWQEVKIVEDQVGISGGFLVKPLSVSCIQVFVKPLSAPSPQEVTDKIHMRFVEVAKNSEWFLKAVGGVKTQKGELGSVRVLEELRNRLSKKCDAAVADDSEDDIEKEDDPMDALDDVLETPCKKTKSDAKPKAKGKTMTQSSIVEVIMPKRPPCAGEDDGDFTVTLYLYGLNKHSKMKNVAKVIIRVDCISWLIAYAADEHFFQGVLRVEDEEPKAANSTAVAGLNIEWDFTCDAWKAEFVSGALLGTVRTLAMTDVSEKLWKKMVASSLPGAEGNFKETSVAKKKQVCKEFMELWSGAIAAKNEKVFEKSWGLRNLQRNKKEQSPH